MNDRLKVELAAAFALTRELLEHLEESALRLDLPGLPSNQIAGQVWCIVGARESYTRAIEAGEWQGFDCSLEAPDQKAPVLEALDASQEQLATLDFGTLSDAQVEIAFRLLEHEVQHHGQLIRYVYANRLTFPASWNARYTV